MPINRSSFLAWDYDGREADALVEMPDGEWSAIEIKLGSRQEDAAAKSLIDLKKRIAAKGGQPPSALVVLGQRASCPLTCKVVVLFPTGGTPVVPVNTACRALFYIPSWPPGFMP